MSDVIDNDKAETLRGVITALDPADDSNWSSAGRPDCMVLKKLCGFLVTKKMLAEVAPDVRRPGVQQEQPRQATLVECNAIARKHAAMRAAEAE